MAASCCLPLCSDVSVLEKLYADAVIRERNFRKRLRNSCRSSKRKSSNVPIRPKDLCVARRWSSSAPSPGSIDVEGLPRIGKSQSKALAFLRLASIRLMLRNFVIPLDVSGRTLRTQVSMFSSIIFQRNMFIVISMSYSRRMRAHYFFARLCDSSPIFSTTTLLGVAGFPQYSAKRP